jgi:ketosteroid isomerase-like protein
MSIIKTTATLLFIIFIVGCNATAPGQHEIAKREIEKAEKDFEAMATDKGIAEAFYFFADSNATIKRQNDTLIHGKDGIRNFYSTPFYKAATVKWSPDFIETSAQGDMGYTYGNYHWESKDSTGKAITFDGVFHTVWKKQLDGTWKYVWD